MKNFRRTFAKASCFFLSLLIICLSLHAQVDIKKTLAESSARAKNNPTISSPAVGSVITGPFVLVGKGEPNATITLHITPVSKLPNNTTGRPLLVVSGPLYKPQDFTFAANAKGVWQSPLIEVKFNEKNTDKKIQVFAAQAWGTYHSAGKVYEYPAQPKLQMISVPVTIPKKEENSSNNSGNPQHDEGAPVKGQDNSNPPLFQVVLPKNNDYVAHDDFRVSGIAGPNTSVRVEVRYWGYKSKSNVTVGNFGPIFFPEVDKNTTVANNELWGTYTARTGTAMWQTDTVRFIKKIDGYSCWANDYEISASLIDENGKSVYTKKFRVTRMKTTKVK